MHSGHLAAAKLALLLVAAPLAHGLSLSRLGRSLASHEDAEASGASSASSASSAQAQGLRRADARDLSAHGSSAVAALALGRVRRRGDPSCAPSCDTDPAIFGQNGSSLVPRVWAALGPISDIEPLADSLTAYGGFHRIVADLPAQFWEAVQSQAGIYEGYAAAGRSHREVLDEMSRNNLTQFKKGLQANLANFPTEKGPVGRTLWAPAYTDKNTLWIEANFSEAITQADHYATGAESSGYAVGKFLLAEQGTVLVRCTSPFSLDSGHLWLLPDIYDGRRAVHAIQLDSGMHNVLVRFSGSGFWCDVTLDSKEARSYVTGVPVLGNESKSQLVAMKDTIASDIVDGFFASPHVGVPLLNTGAGQLELESVGLVGAPSQLQVKLAQSPQVWQSGQIYTARLELLQRGPVQCMNMTEGDTFQLVQDYKMNITLEIKPVDSPPVQVLITVSCYPFSPAGYPAGARAAGYRVAFPDYDGSVQHMWVAPPNISAGRPASGYPTMLSLHGAQVTISPNWGQNYGTDPWKVFPYPAWLVQPSNRFEFGTDWEGPGLDNAYAAMAYVTENLPGASLEQRAYLGIDTARILVTGHSMGGHGCMVFSTHEPDRLLGSVCAAPWPSLAHYSGSGSVLLDSARAGVQKAVVSEHAADYLASNIRGNPMTLIYGDQDDNVPPSEPRYFARLVGSYSGNKDAVKIVELPGFGHWFVQDIPEVKEALWKLFPKDGGVAQLPGLPEQFEFTVVQPRTFGSKGNVKLLQAADASRPMKLFVKRCGPPSTTNTEDEACTDLTAVSTAKDASHDEPWIIATDNIRRFTFVEPPKGGNLLPRAVLVDGQAFNLTSLGATSPPGAAHFCRAADEEFAQWRVCKSALWQSKQRGGPSAGAGPLHMTMRRAPLCIVYGSGTVQFELARHLANKMYFVSRYSVPIVKLAKQNDTLDGYCASANLIAIGSPDTNAWISSHQCAFSYLRFRGSSFSLLNHAYGGPGVGLLALGRLGGGRLAMLVHGTSHEALLRAGQRVPISSWQDGGDFMVLGADAAWEGSGGLLASGYLDAQWKPTSSSWAQPEHSVRSHWSGAPKLLAMFRQSPPRACPEDEAAAEADDELASA